MATKPNVWGHLPRAISQIVSQFSKHNDDNKNWRTPCWSIMGMADNTTLSTLENFIMQVLEEHFHTITPANELYVHIIYCLAKYSNKQEGFRFNKHPWLFWLSIDWFFIENILDTLLKMVNDRYYAEVSAGQHDMYCTHLIGNIIAEVGGIKDFSWDRDRLLIFDKLAFSIDYQGLGINVQGLWAKEWHQFEQLTEGNLWVGAVCEEFVNNVTVHKGLLKPLTFESKYKYYTFYSDKWNGNATKHSNLNFKELQSNMFEENIIYNQQKHTNEQFKKMVKQIQQSKEMKCVSGPIVVPDGLDNVKFIDGVSINWILPKLFDMIDDSVIKYLVLLAMAVLQSNLQMGPSALFIGVFVSLKIPDLIAMMNNLNNKFDFGCFNDVSIKWYEFIVISEYLKMCLHKDLECFPQQPIPFKLLPSILSNWDFLQQHQHYFVFEWFNFINAMYGKKGRFPPGSQLVERLAFQCLPDISALIARQLELNPKAINYSVPSQCWGQTEMQGKIEDKIEEKIEDKIENKIEDKIEDQIKNKIKDKIELSQVMSEVDEKMVDMDISDGSIDESDEWEVDVMKIKLPTLASTFDAASSVATGKWGGSDTRSVYQGPSYMSVCAPSVAASHIIFNMPSVDISSDKIQRDLNEDKYSLTFDFDGPHAYLIKSEICLNGKPKWAQQTFSKKHDTVGAAYYECRDYYLYQHQFSVPYYSAHWQNQTLGQEKGRSLWVDKKKILWSELGSLNSWTHGVCLYINQNRLKDLALSPLCRSNNENIKNYCQLLNWASVKDIDKIATQFVPFDGIDRMSWVELVNEIEILGRLSSDYAVPYTKDAIMEKNECRMQKYEPPGLRVMSSHCQYLQGYNVCGILYILAHPCATMPLVVVVFLTGTHETMFGQIHKNGQFLGRH